MHRTFPPEPKPLVEALAVLLDVATTALDQVHPEALALFELLAPLSPQACTTLLSTLEREVAARTASLAAGDGAIGPLDRRSQLFVRVFERDSSPPPLTPTAVYQSSLQGMVRLASFPSDMEEAILAGVGDAVAELTTDERAILAHVVRAEVTALEESLVVESA